jgi:hypothetical protein
MDTMKDGKRYGDLNADGEFLKVWRNQLPPPKKKTP